MNISFLRLKTQSIVCSVSIFLFLAFSFAEIDDPLLKGIVLCSPSVSLDEIENIAGIRIIGLDLPGNQQQVSALLSSLLSQPLNIETIKEIRTSLSEYFSKEGRPLILVSIPEQDVTEGVLKLTVMESCIGQVRVEGNSWTSSTRMKKYINLEKGQTIDENQLVQNLNFINRNPFRNVDVIYSPGGQPGTTDVTLSVKDRKPFRLYAGVDNTGIRPLGTTRWFAGVNWGNVFNLDHIFTYQYTVGSCINKFQSHNFQYIAPLSWKHLLSFYGGYARMHAHLHFPKLRHTGYAYQLSSRYTIPFGLTRFMRQDCVIGADFKRLNTTEDFYIEPLIIGKNVNVTQLVLGYINRYDRETYRMDVDGDLYWSPGKWVADQTQNDYRSLRPGAKNHWVYGRAAFSFLKKISHSLLFNFKLRGQLASTNLIATEQLGIGGYDTVRGYEEREVNTDNGIIANAELRISPPFHLLKRKQTHDVLQCVAFLDYGYGKNHQTIPGGPNHQWLLGMGPGLRYTIEPYLTARIDWGIKLHHSLQFTNQKNFIYFSVIGSY